KGDVLACQKFLGDANGIPRRGAVVAKDDLQFAPAEDATFGVDLVLSELHAVAIGHGEDRHAAVGIELANFYRLALRLRRRRGHARQAGDSERPQDATPRLTALMHAVLPCCVLVRSPRRNQRSAARSPGAIAVANDKHVARMPATAN